MEKINIGYGHSLHPDSLKYGLLTVNLIMLATGIYKTTVNRDFFEGLMHFTFFVIGVIAVSVMYSKNSPYMPYIYIKPDFIELKSSALKKPTTLIKEQISEIRLMKNAISLKLKTNQRFNLFVDGETLDQVKISLGKNGYINLSKA